MSDPLRPKIPSVQILRNLVTLLDSLVRVSGPNTPPGYEAGYHAGTRWATSLAFSIFASVKMAECEAIAAPHGSKTGQTTQGWPGPIHQAMFRVQEITMALLEEWGVRRSADEPPYPGHPEARMGDPMPDFPLVLSDADHEGLEWARDVFRAALLGLDRRNADATGQNSPMGESLPPPGPTPPPNPSDEAFEAYRLYVKEGVIQTKIAEQLSISQAAVSRHIADVKHHKGEGPPRKKKR